MSTSTWREKVRQNLEKVLWKHYNDGGYSMNGEKASKEILAVFSAELLAMAEELKGAKRELKMPPEDEGDEAHDIATAHFTLVHNQALDLAITILTDAAR